MWMSILLATGKRYGSSKEDYRISSILIFEMIDEDESSTLEKHEFVKACMKGLLGKVRKKQLNVKRPGQPALRHIARTPEHVWKKLSMLFDTVGGNAIWCTWSSIQVCFCVKIWGLLSEVTTVSLEKTQGSIANKIFNMSLAEVLKDSLDEEAWFNENQCGDMTSDFHSETIPFANGEVFRHMFKENFNDAYEDKFISNGFLVLDNIFIFFALAECILRCMVYRKRSLDYPTFSKRAIPRMEAIDLGICIVLVLLTIVSAILDDSEKDAGAGRRTLIAIRGIRMARIFPAVTRFRSTDHNLLTKQMISGRKLGKKQWLHDLFDFSARLEMNYDMTNNVSKSTKGPFMR